MAVPGGRAMAVMDHRRWCGTAERRRKRERREMASLTGGIVRGEEKKGALQMCEPALAASEE